jgi:hypothetical protein
MLLVAFGLSFILSFNNWIRIFLFRMLVGILKSEESRLRINVVDSEKFRYVSFGKVPVQVPIGIITCFI